MLGNVYGLSSLANSLIGNYRMAEKSKSGLIPLIIQNPPEFHKRILGDLASKNFYDT
jgi:hypothetical protein